MNNNRIACPTCNRSNFIKYGTRFTNLGKIQIYYCKNCNNRFSTKPLKRSKYPPTIILRSISTYNLGNTLQQTNMIINRKFKTSIPQSTIHSWLQRYQDICTFTSKLRKHYELDPKSLIFSKKFHHQQVYDFKYHTLKLNIAGKKFPQLKAYIQSLPDKCPDKPFQYGPRCSSFRIDVKPTKTTKQNNAIKLTELALSLAKTNRERHQKVEDFFLINDSATIAIEIPVYLYPYELNKNELKTYGIEISKPLSGHIDILQVRWNKIHILDYKPDAKLSDKPTAEQLFLYALALSKRTKISLNKFTCAYFDENYYYQFTPSSR